MTVIKSIVAKGFKSFAKRTELVFGDDFNVILGPNGSGKSTRGDTLILLASGKLKPIKDLVDEALNSSKIHIKMKDGVYTPENKEKVEIIALDPETMKAKKQNINAFIKREGEPFLYQITTKTGRKVTTTGCHPIMIYKNGEIKSEIVENLNKGKFIALPNKLNFQNKKTKLEIEGITKSKNFDENFSRFLGYLVGDGCIVKDRRVDFVNADEELLSDYENIIREFGFKPCFSNRKDSKAITIYLNSKKFANNLIKFFKNNYKKDKKHIPHEILFSNKINLANFLGGLFDCDASLRKDNPAFEYVTMSERLANEVMLGLLRFGIVARKKEKLKYASNTEKKTKKIYFHIMIEGKGKLNRLHRNIYLKCNHKRNLLKHWSENKIIENPNNDLLPREVNKLIKKCREDLFIGYKPLRKKYPRFAAYNENRCCPTRQGILESISIFNKKIKEMENISLTIDQRMLTSAIKEINISRAVVAQNIGVTRHTVTNIWDKGMFNAKPENLEKLYLFLKEELTSKLTIAKDNIQTLTNLANSDIFWDQIAEIKKVKGEKYVYDLSVPKYHNFIGNGIFVHNSNVCDVLCFVLGKSSAKSLRAEKSANLIYNGGKKGAPAKQAEATIVFDNSKQSFKLPEKEITITRLLKNNGNSIYLLNGKKVTRQQTLDVLSQAKIHPDGHNIVLQGDIVHFMEMKPLERRQILEDISGISVFEEKKSKALNELEKVDTKLIEVEIILKEREANLRELKKDRDQAKKYKELQSRIKDNKATYINSQITQKQERISDVEKKIKEQESKINKIEDLIQALRKNIETKLEQISTINKDIEEKGEKEQLVLRENISQSKESIIKITSRIDTLNNELNKLEERNSQLNNSIQEFKNEINSLNQQKNSLNNNLKERTKQELDLNKKIDSFKSKYGIADLSEINSQIEKIDSAINNLRKETYELQENKQKLIREKDQVDFKMASIEEKINEVLEMESEDKEKTNSLKKLRQDFKDVTLTLNKKLTEDSSYSSQLFNARKSLLQTNEELARLRARNIGISEKNAADFAVKKILDSKNPGIYGTIASLGNVSSKHALALEVAAGPRINSIVVKDDLIAAKCIQTLKDSRQGIAAFLPLNKIKKRIIPSEINKLSKHPDVIGYAIDLVKFDKKFSNAFSYVFGPTLVIKDLQTARKLGIGSARFVTLEGDLIEPSGAMIGGFRRKQALGFSEIEVNKDIIKLENEMERLSGITSLVEKKKIDNESLIINLRQEKANLEGEIIKIEKSLGFNSDISELKKQKLLLQESSQSLLDKISQLETNFDEKNQEIKDSNKILDTLRGKLSQNPEINKNLKSLEESKQSLREDIIKINSEINNLNDKISMISQESEKTSKIINVQEREKQEFTKELSNLKEVIKSKTKELSINEKKERDSYGKFKNLAIKRNQIQEKIKKDEQFIFQEEEKLKSFESRINNFSIDKAKFIAETEGLQREFEDFKDGKIRRNVSVDELKLEIREFEKMMDKMGNVNLRALEIYEDLEREHQKLVEKSSKITLEKDDILSLISDIESQKTGIFMKTFKEIATNFKTIFSSLSTKGDAFLELENKEQPLNENEGIDIRVRLTGNKFMDVKGLSGGEKTLVALSLIFAIQEHDPASFYLLDEVDAALDKHNSEKLSLLIKKYAEKAQYIVISHNDAIISEASQIYGVSMQNNISNVVSLKV